MSRAVSLVGQSTTEILERLNQTENKTEQAEERRTEKREKGSVFAGDLNLCDDSVAQKRKEAQKKAMQVLQDAWESDGYFEEEVQERRDHYAKMEMLRSEAADEVESINQKNQEIKETYGVADDSQEQKDFELLCKKADYMAGNFDSPLTKEEWERCAQIEKEGLSDYQKYGLELHNRAAYFKGEMAEAEKQMKDDQADIRRIQLDHLKVHIMVDAQKDADKILESASKEIIGMLTDEVVDKIDEAKEEAAEKAEETTEKKKEEEEALDEIRLKRAQQEALMLGTKEAVEEAKAQERKSEMPDIHVEDMVDIANSYRHADDIKQSIEDIKNNMKLLDADLKGIQVDEEI